MKFAADAMLGRLAKWLRLLGFDTSYQADIEDNMLVRTARQEGRLILTRDTRLFGRLRDGEALLVSDDRVKVQLAQVLEFLKMPRSSFALLSRCAVCNEVLREAGKDEVRDRVPEFVLCREKSFRQCTSCGRVYWPGTHAGRIAQNLKSLGL
jgi:uncharacterized protein